VVTIGSLLTSAAKFSLVTAECMPRESDALRRVDRAGAPREHRRFASLADLLKGLFERRIQEF